MMKITVNCSNKGCTRITDINIKEDETIEHLFKVIKKRGWVRKDGKICCSSKCKGKIERKPVKPVKLQEKKGHPVKSKKNGFYSGTPTLDEW